VGLRHRRVLFIKEARTEAALAVAGCVGIGGTIREHLEVAEVAVLLPDGDVQLADAALLVALQVAALGITLAKGSTEAGLVDPVLVADRVTDGVITAVALVRVELAELLESRLAVGAGQEAVAHRRLPFVGEIQADPGEMSVWVGDIELGIAGVRDRRFFFLGEPEPGGTVEGAVAVRGATLEQVRCVGLEALGARATVHIVLALAADVGEWAACR
jgi:hypothetical protein